VARGGFGRGRSADDESLPKKRTEHFVLNLARSVIMELIASFAFPVSDLSWPDGAHHPRERVRYLIEVSGGNPCPITVLRPTSDQAWRSFHFLLLPSPYLQQ
jgi:hypothetical protein